MRRDSYSFVSAFALAALLLIGIGCQPVSPALELPTAPPEEASPTQPPAPDGASASAGASVNANVAAPPSTAAKPYYIAYSADAYAKAKAEGRPVLLYFWAGWCPICRAEEPKVKVSVESSGVPVAGFRVEYDMQEDLKKEFRVPYQHTTIILDIRGNESARFTGPTSDADLQAALAIAAGK